MLVRRNADSTPPLYHLTHPSRRSKLEVHSSKLVVPAQPSSTTIATADTGHASLNSTLCRTASDASERSPCRLRDDEVTQGFTDTGHREVGIDEEGVDRGLIGGASGPEGNRLCVHRIAGDEEMAKTLITKDTKVTIMRSNSAIPPCCS